MIPQCVLIAFGVVAFGVYMKIVLEFKPFIQAPNRFLKLWTAWTSIAWDIVGAEPCVFFNNIVYYLEQTVAHCWNAGFNRSVGQIYLVFAQSTVWLYYTIFRFIASISRMNPAVRPVKTGVPEHLPALVKGNVPVPSGLWKQLDLAGSAVYLLPLRL